RAEQAVVDGAERVAGRAALAGDAELHREGVGEAMADRRRTHRALAAVAAKDVAAGVVAFDHAVEKQIVARSVEARFDEARAEAAAEIGEFEVSQVVEGARIGS